MPPTASRSGSNSPLDHRGRGIALVALLLSGCPTPGSSPCQEDAFGCEAPSEFVIDETCSLSEPLALSVGDGEAGYRDLATDRSPKLHYGPQGSAHMFLGVRVERADQRYNSFQFDLRVYLGADGSEYLEDQRSIVVSDTLLDGDTFEQDKIVMFVYDGQAGRIVAEVTDSCGRKATAEHAFTQER